MRVLLIDNDPAIAQSIEIMLKADDFNVYTTDLGDEGLGLAKMYDYDCIVLAPHLPDMTGVDLVRKLRKSKVGTPVIIESQDQAITSKVEALNAGADDYIVRPFHKDELVARILAVTRRSRGHAQSLIITGGLSVNLDTRTAKVDGQTLSLTGKEFQMLELLALRKGATLTKEMFLNHLYGGMDEPELKIIDVFICKLRKKLAAAGNGKYDGIIKTVWGRGYTLEDPEAEKVQYAAPGTRNPVGRAHEGV